LKLSLSPWTYKVRRAAGKTFSAVKLTFWIIIKEFVESPSLCWAVICNKLRVSCRKVNKIQIKLKNNYLKTLLMQEPPFLKGATMAILRQAIMSDSLSQISKIESLRA